MCLVSISGLALEIRDSSGDLQDAIVGTSAQALLSHSSFKQVLAVSGKTTERSHVPRRHLSVAINRIFAVGMEPRKLPLARVHHSLQDLCRTFRLMRASHFLVVHGGNINVDVDAIEQRTGDLRNVALNHRRRAVALVRAIVVKTAGTRIHGSGKHKAGREREGHGSACDADSAFFRCLPIMQLSVRLSIS